MEGPNEDWIRRQLRELSKNSDEIRNVAPDVTNEFNQWSAIKLVLLAGAVEVYTKIIPGNYDDMYYVDCLAGSGTVELEDDYLIGSPILAVATAREMFDKMYFIEYDKARAKALKERLTFVAESFDYEFHKDDFEVMNGDVNREARKVIRDIKNESYYQDRKPHHFAFVDNEGVKEAAAHWSTIEELSKIYCDLLINFPSSAISRVGGKNLEDSMKKFFGDNRWKGPRKDRDELRGIYKGNIAVLEQSKEVQRHVNVSGPKSYEYDVIYATYETAAGSPYVDAFDYFKQNLEPLTVEKVQMALDFINGRRTELDLFPDSKGEDEEDDDMDQTSLGQF